MSTNELGDIWTGQAAAGTQSAMPPQTAAAAGLQSEVLGPIDMLDAQFGLDPKLCTPDALAGELFGQPAPSAAEIAAVDGDPQAVPPMATFAVLDAAKVRNLPELLATSGLEHECLFIGEAKEDLAEVAPWIVHLEPGAALTRHLFTKGKAPWQLWDKNPGMVVRARASCADMHKHFRKFLKVQDDSGKWFYFRFWEGTTLLTVAQASAPEDHKRLYRPGMIAYGRRATPDGAVLVKSWIEEPAP